MLGIWDKYRDLAIPKSCWTSPFERFFHCRTKKYLYVGHITMWRILRKTRSVVREPQNMLLASDVLTPKLSCLRQPIHLMFETSIIEWIKLCHIRLVVTCNGYCTCHHLTIVDEKYNFWGIWRTWNKYRDLAIRNVARISSLNAFFHSWVKKYPCVVICLSGGDIQNKSKSKTIRLALSFWPLLFLRTSVFGEQWCKIRKGSNYHHVR